jgi:hypothetical protein
MGTIADGKSITIVGNKGEKRTLQDGEIVIFFDMYLAYKGIRPIAYYSVKSRQAARWIKKLADFIDLPNESLEHPIKKSGRTTEIWLSRHREILDVIITLIFSDYFDPMDRYIWILGKLCRIPFCCINNYIDSKNPGKDYLRQLNGRKNQYNIRIVDNGTTEDYISYIPCSPDCKATKKLYKEYKFQWNEMFKDYGRF